MEYTLGVMEFSTFVLSGYFFVKWQKKQINLMEFIDFVQKATVFNPKLLKTVMDVHGPTIYQKSFKRFEEDTHFARGVGFVQGFVKCENPIKSILNSSSKLVLSKLTSESIYSNGEFSRTDTRNVVTNMVNSFEISDSPGDSRISVNTSNNVDYKKSLHVIHSTSQIRSMTSTEKMMSWVIFMIKVVISTFNIGKNFKGFQVGHKNVEKGIVVGQYIVAFGEIVFDRISKELRMENPILFLKDKLQMINTLKSSSTTKGRNMTFVFILMVISAIMFIRRLKKWIVNLVKKYKVMKEMKRMEKTFELSRNLSEAYICTICVENAKNVIFRPCLHLCICKLCYNRLRQQICPVCKTAIESTISIYIT